MGILLAAMLTLSSKTLRIIAYVILVIFTAMGVMGAFASLYFDAGAGIIESAPTATLDSLGAYFSTNTQMALGLLAMQPFAALQLSAAGVLPAEWEMPLFVLNQAVGYLTGPGILAALALATDSLHNQVPGWARAFVALGKRSMSGYLAQSVLFIVLCTPAFLGIGLDASVTGKLLLGLLVWAITLLLAVVLDRAGKQGPFEWAHRHLSYGTTGRIEPKYDHVQVAG